MIIFISRFDMPSHGPTDQELVLNMDALHREEDMLLAWDHTTFQVHDSWWAALVARRQFNLLLVPLSPPPSSVSVGITLFSFLKARGSLLFFSSLNLALTGTSAKTPSWSVSAWPGSSFRGLTPRLSINSRKK